MRTVVVERVFYTTPMRRADPDRLAEAKREGLVARLADTIGRAQAEALYANYEDQAAAVGLSPLDDAFWREIEPSMARELARRHQGAA